MKIAETALTTLFVFHAFILMIPSKGEKKKSNQIKILVRGNLEEINENVKLTQSFNVKKKEIKKRSACDGVHYEMTISLICFGFILVRDAAASGVSRSIATTSSWRPF
jgi:hypothetical protein